MNKNVIEESAKEYRFRLNNIVKRFGTSVALDGVDLEVQTGEVIGLIGPNGAGKSTLMSVLTGIHTATEGDIELNGVRYDKKAYNTTVARENGIACCYQELSVCNNLTIYENFAIMVMDHKPFGRFGWRKEMAKLAKDMLDDVFPDNGLNVNTKVERLSIEQKQMVEICCAMATNDLKILIFDEPTSSLGTERIEQFHNAIGRWKDKGISIIYISHKLEEIINISTRIVVMRNAKVIQQLTTEDVNVENLIEIMGGKLSSEYVAGNSGKAKGELLLEIDKFSNDSLHDISMTIHKGEIIGVSGLGGSGQRELLNEVFKEFQKRGQSKKIKTYGKASFVSGDRQKEGIFKLWSIADNIVISSLDLISDFQLINKEKSDRLAQSWYDNLKFRAQGKEDNITNLSGGNQQKAIIGRGIASEADLIIFDDPTRGVDAGTKKDIYQIIQDIAATGKSVLWYSTEDNEMLECDRVYVMRDGAIVDELQKEQISVDAVVASSFKKAKTEDKKKKEKAGILGKLSSWMSSGSGISVVVLAVIWIILSMLNKNVNTRMGLVMMIGSALPLVFVALGQMFMLEVGDINMGIGNAMGLISVIAATFMIANTGLGFLAILGFVAIYTLTAVLIHKRNMPSIVVSLGMSSVWLGIALLIQETPGGSCPEWIMSIFSLQTPVFPVQVYICILAALLSYWLVFRFKYGMVIRGIGDNPGSITKRGWSYFLARVIAYLISAIFVVLAGLIFVYQGRGSDATSASTYQMQTIVVVLLGGCAFSGGIVDPVGVVAGALSISLITSMLTMLQVHSDYRTAVIGIILIFVLFLRAMINRRKK